MIELLRHTLATIAYRAGKTLRSATPDFAGFRAGPKSRTPAQILAHMGDLFDWALALVEGQLRWKDSTPLDWNDEADRFFKALEALDARLASGAPLACSPNQLFQGPIADALTHVGQLAMLRGLAGCPCRGENYFKADIVVGRVGPNQTAPAQEFG